MKLVLLMLKNLRRNLVRTSLTCMAIFVLVLVVTLIWSFLHLLDSVTEAKAGEQKGLVTERWQFPSMMPLNYADGLEYELDKLPNQYKPLDYMTWQFVAGSVQKNPSLRKPSDTMFMLAMDPKKMRMLDEIDELSDATIQKLIDNDRGLLIGRDRLNMIDKKVGDKVTMYCANYKEIEIEMDIIGLLPGGRYAQSVFFHKDYLKRLLDDYERKKGKPHDMLDKTMNLFWFKVRNTESIDKAATQIDKSGRFVTPAVKVETGSSAISTFIEPFRDMLWGLRFLLTPAILIVLSLVIANAISISVRERRSEMAVLKVLGFRPNQILMLVLGEVLFLGAGTGMLCAVISYFGTWALGGIKFPVVFFPAFYIPIGALWWGPAIGAGAALVGSFIPAWGARSIKVSEVFSKVA